MKGKHLTKLSMLLADARMAVAYDTQDAKHKMEMAFTEWASYLSSLSESTRRRYDKTHQAIEDFYKTNQVEGLGTGTWPCSQCVSRQECVWKPSTPEKRKLEELPPLPTLKRHKAMTGEEADEILAELLSTAPTELCDGE